MDRYKFVRSLASLTLVTGALVLGGCFDKPPNVDYDAGPPDAEVPDAAPPCQPSTTVCDDTAGVYVECDSTGMPAVVMQCPLGCASDAEKCLDVDPSNGLASYLDRARDDDTVIDVALTGTATVDTTTGEFSVNGTPLSVTTEVFNGIRIFMFKTLTVSGTLKATGSLPLALVADGDIAITGLIDVSADGTAQGPGAVTEDSSCMGSLHGVSGPHPDPTPGGGGGGH